MITIEKIYLTDIISLENMRHYGFNTDYNNRKCAITYINGELLEGETHKDTIEEYLKNNGLGTDALDYETGFVTWEEQEDINLPMAFGSYIEGIDGKKYIAIYTCSLFNVYLENVVTSLREKYPDAIICEDNNDRYESHTQDVYLEIITKY